MKKQLLLIIAFLFVMASVHGQWTTATNGTDIYYNTGKVGIGITTPVEMLHINGNILSDQVSTNNGIYNTSSGNLFLQTTGTNRLSILNGNGFVGIGNIAPTEMLHVSGNFLSNQVFTVNGIYGAVPNSNLFLRTNNLDRLTVLNTNGFVGIGSSSPEDKLQISGGNLVIDNGNVATIFTGTGSSELNRYLQLGNSAALQSPSGLKAGGILIADNYGFANPAKNDLIVKGKVGIGTSLSANPNNYTLAVNGTVGAKDVRVEKTSTTWPDYVFQKNYDLPSLRDVADYIRVNKHLKDIPSAEEVEKNGHSLGDMDAILLKKVEELTLYVLQQQKEIEALKKKLNEK